MANVKDLLVNGSARVIGTIYGNATSANKLNTNAGSASQPVYFSNGIPVAITNTISNNAASATKLLNARNFKIGNTSKSFNGTADVTWTHAEIGATVSNTWTGGTTTGPTLKTTVNGVTGAAVVIPSASTGASGVVTTGAQTFAGNKTFTGQLIKNGVSSSWTSGRDDALLRMNSINGYSPAISIKTTNGSWDISAYDHSSFTDDLIFSYVTDTDYNASSNRATSRIKFLENGHIVAALDGNASTATTATNLAAAGTWTWSNGTTAGPTASLVLGGKTTSIGAIPSANSSISGIITTGDQSFAGLKSFDAIGVTNTSSSTGKGISLYGGAYSGAPTYGLMFSGISTFGSHGWVTSDWATYFTMNDQNNRGWVFRRHNSKNVFSIDTDGYVWANGPLRTEAAGKDGFITYPRGGHYSTTTESVTGYLRIQLPVYRNNSMVKFIVDIYNYADNTSVSYAISGHNWQSGGWYGCTAECLSHHGQNKQNLTVAFGEMNSKSAVMIGAKDTVWSHPQVQVRDIVIGYSNWSYKYWNNEDWIIDFSTSPIGNVTKSFSNTDSIKVSTGQFDQVTATQFNGLLNGHANSSTYLYADNSPYRYGDSNPYYAHMTYNTNGDNRWYLRVAPETPKAIAVDYAYNAGSTNHYNNNAFRSQRDFVNGTLITTDLDGGTANCSIPFLLEIKGNGYATTTPLFVQAQGYVYMLGNGYSSYINVGGQAIGTFASYIQAFKDSNGRLAFWFPRVDYWQGYDVFCWNCSEGINTKNLVNHVISISNSALPSSRSYTTTINLVHIWRSGDSVTGAVWNDYAEYREADTIQGGRCVREVGDDTLALTTKRLMRGCSITSDTWGFAQGETDKAKTPIAVAGRVLAYPLENRELFREYIGYSVCSGPDGTVSLMTEEEELKYPWAIVGTVSAVPDYEEWGGGENADRPSVKVDGRIWIKVK